jgi:glycopeptide antibiotics resistance protein
VLLKDPLVFSAEFRDEPLYFTRFFLFSFLWSLCLWQWKASNPVLKGVLISAVLGFVLESSQLIIISRMPTAQDIIVMLCGSAIGGLFISYWPFVFSGRIWSLLIIIVTAVSAAFFSLSPFQWTGLEDRMNWFPFLPYYEITTFMALSNFIESVLIYFPMGFLLQYFNNHKRTYIIAPLIAVTISFPLEYSQKWIVGRYPDVTDVIGAVFGAFLGAIVCRNGWEVFTNYIEEISIKKEMA